MRTLVIYSRSSTQRPRSVLASLCHWLCDHGHQVSVLDISHFSLINQDLPPQWFAGLFNHRVYKGALEEVLANLGVAVKLLVPDYRNKVPLPASVEAELDDAITSDLVTYVNSDVVDSSRGIARWVKKGIDTRARALYRQLGDYLVSNPFDLVYIPNGRVPEQRMAIEASRAAGLEHRYYEIGRAKPQSFYVGKTQVHDRAKTQDEIPEVLGRISKATIKRMAVQWLTERTRFSSGINVYSAGWRTDHGSEALTGSTASTAVFFSSSVDEFASYGPAWKLDSWSSQYDAFEKIMTVLEAKGVQCVLRIHPNLTNKSRDYFARELREIESLQRAHPKLKVFWHNDPVNSYELVRHSDYVVVGRSTLGLEANLMGKCVWVTTASRYDRIADVKKAWSTDDINDGNFSLWTVDPTGAQKFVAYWALQDHEFTFGERSWCTWDSFRAPPMLRLGQLFLKNPWRHKLHLMQLELTRRKNLRFQPK